MYLLLFVSAVLQAENSIFNIKTENLLLDIINIIL